MSFSQLGAELKNQASQKVDQAKDKANDLATDAKQKGQGNENLSFEKNLITKLSLSSSEIKHDAQQKGKFIPRKFFISIQLFFF